MLAVEKRITSPLLVRPRAGPVCQQPLHPPCLQWQHPVIHTCQSLQLLHDCGFVSSKRSAVHMPEGLSWLLLLSLFSLLCAAGAQQH